MNIEILYQDNHIIAINKSCGEIVQADETGDEPLSQKVAEYIKEKYNKPGEAFIGVVHRIDRPTSGIVLFARTSKALTRLNEMLKNQEIKKVYWAITQHRPELEEGNLRNWLLKREKSNKAIVSENYRQGYKEALLHYKLLYCLKNYFLIETEIKTGRHHQIRAQLANIGCPIKGDLKYGAQRSNKDGGICLHARRVELMHPIKKELIVIEAPVPNTDIWREFYNLKF